MQADLFPDIESDICAARHGRNAESARANAMVQKDRDCARVLAFLRRRGDLGATLDETSVELNVAPNRISGRFTELKRDGRIVPTGRRQFTRTGAVAVVYRVSDRTDGHANVDC